MPKFCMYCGRPLKEGETCHCQENGYTDSPQEELPEFEEEYPGFGQDDDYAQEEDEGYYYSQDEEEPQEDEEYYTSQNEEEYYTSQNEEESQEDEGYYYSQGEEEYQEDEGYYTSQNEEESQEDDGYYYSQGEEEPQEDEGYYTSQNEEESQEDDGYYYSQGEEEPQEDDEYYTSQNEEESQEDDGYYYSQGEEEPQEDEGYYTSQNEEESQEDDGYYYGQEEEELQEIEEYEAEPEEDERYYNTPDAGEAQGDEANYYSQDQEDYQEEEFYYGNQEDVSEENEFQPQEEEFYYNQESDAEDIGNAEAFSQNQNRNHEKKKDEKRERMPREPQWEQEHTQGSAPGLLETLQMVSGKIGGALDAVYNFLTPTDKPGRIVNGVDGRKLFGFSKEDKVAQVEDCYERGLQIVPDLIQPCGQEIPIRQYDICATRSLLKGTWQEGRLQVTNKRVLFRLSGRNWIGKMQKSVEFAIDDVTGMDIRNGNRLSFVALFLNTYFAALFFAMGGFLTSHLPLLACVLGIAGAIGISLLVRKHYYAKLAVFSFAFAPMNMWAMEQGRVWQVIAVIITICFILYYILASIRPNFSFKILTKSGGVSPIEEKRVDTVLTMLFNYFIARGMDVLPGKDAERAMDEVGTMIMDIQKFGDFGIQKWKEN